MLNVGDIIDSIRLLCHNNPLPHPHYGAQENVQKKGKLDTSHRYNLLPLLPSGPGGI